MVRTGATPVITAIRPVRIPPLLEAVFPITTNKKTFPDNYVIEGELRPPRNGLWVARTLVNLEQRMTCRVINTTDKAIILRPEVAVGSLSMVTIPTQSEPHKQNRGTAISIGEMKKTSQDLTIPFEDTAVKGKNLDNLVTLIRIGT